MPLPTPSNSVPALKDRIAEVNCIANRISGATKHFFSPCSLGISNSNYAELRFVRAVLFYYSLFIECGTKPVRFCSNQTQFKSLLSGDPNASLKFIHALRTQIAHSLDASSHSSTIEATARSWFRQHTRADFPTSEDEWGRCFQAIDQLGSSLLAAIETFLRDLEGDPEMEFMRKELRRSIDGGLSRIDIESLVAEILKEQRREDLSPGRLTERYHSQWTNILSLKSSRVDLLDEARKLIEQTVFETKEQPPLTGREIMEKLSIPPGPLVGELMREQSAIFLNGTRKPDEILGKLREYVVNRTR